MFIPSALLLKNFYPFETKFIKKINGCSDFFPKPGDGKRKGRFDRNRPHNVGGKLLHSLLLQGDSDSLSHPYKKRRRQRKARGITLTFLVAVRLDDSRTKIKET
jgi:hypothetical protein